MPTRGARLLRVSSGGRSYDRGTQTASIGRFHMRLFIKAHRPIYHASGTLCSRFRMVRGTSLETTPNESLAILTCTRASPTTYPGEIN
jgi:hypothetical protein